MERLELSEEDTEELWNSPSKRGKRPLNKKASNKDRASPELKPSREGESAYGREETREAELRNELQSVRKINDVIESLLTSLDSAKGNMEVCNLDYSNVSIC